ncbi:protein of unknown function [Taphrina deformans PYCC 5710]|uniref:Glycosyl transferase family 25 domain-containing protein n=1 Tax=Taphrina deformans (strain PYCC 5710 / ATCC 11124 / CBS 356.35 / IMI 108563 / JCM 9778 / NBRC 8474) TaxID=1097556 RepID=R4XN58_TAPDE|nr:protein of unknown function [Taphrina deformans PYCC 5710]|eukprot:CCG84679.1 protein of unknown function [Taphrina deformans PYCC 5710]
MIRSGRTWLSCCAIFAITWFCSILAFSFHEGSKDRLRSVGSVDDSNVQGRYAPLNSTLGFERIEAIVLPHRDDQLDLLALLGHIYGLDINITPGVYPEDVKVQSSKSPVFKTDDESEGNMRIPGEISCWRAHANLWRKMLREKWKTLLVLEGDVDFGLNFRQEFLELTRVIPELESRLTGQSALAYDDSDPFRSHSWDFLQLGWCVESEKILLNGSVQYPSPTKMTTQAQESFRPLFPNFGIKLEPLVHANQRLAKVSLGGSCTVAYAITPRGAAKLLHKTTRQWLGQVDIAISKLSADLDMVAFSVSPPLFAQRKYNNQAGPSSDIGGYRKRAATPALMDFDTTAASNTGFDDEQKIWTAASHLSDASATMALSGRIWPEKTSLGPDNGREWVMRAKKQIQENQFDKEIDGTTMMNRPS